MTIEEYWFWLCNINDIWNGKIKKLIEFFGNPKDIYFAKAENFKEIKGITEKDINNIIMSRTNNKISELEKIKNKGIKFYYQGHKDYPLKLYNIDSPPFSLYVLGDLPEEKSKNIAIVGARACSQYGNSMTNIIAKELAECDVGIISGMARGIDTIAHCGALKSQGKTFAVLGSGLHNIYPRENIGLVNQILNSKGGIISEYPMEAPPLKWQFPLRNRIISGLSDGVFITEAKERSGSLITVDYALNQGKDVFALPGRICDALSDGCNRLIKNGAYPVNSHLDILRILDIDPKLKCKNTIFQKSSLEKELEVVYSCLSFLPKDIHSIIEETGLQADIVLSKIVNLQLLGMVSEPIKNYYARNGNV